jgi:hypothetical protein
MCQPSKLTILLRDGLSFTGSPWKSISQNIHAGNKQVFIFLGKATKKVWFCGRILQQNEYIQNREDNRHIEAIQNQLCDGSTCKSNGQETRCQLGDARLNKRIGNRKSSREESS